MVSQNEEGRNAWQRATQNDQRHRFYDQWHGGTTSERLKSSSYEELFPHARGGKLVPYVQYDSAGRIVGRVMLPEIMLAALAPWIFLQGFAPLADEPRGEDCVPYVQYGPPGRITHLVWMPARFANELRDIGLSEAAAA